MARPVFTFFNDKGVKASVVYHFLEQVVQEMQSPKQRYRIAPLGKRMLERHKIRGTKTNWTGDSPSGRPIFFRIQGFLREKSNLSEQGLTS
jgi:3'-phosphoadenosine 5'-phosphosulfate sulfotransferase (PAPS reductase)/FAD synthetase